MTFATDMQELAVDLVEDVFVSVSKLMTLTQLGEWDQDLQSASTVATDVNVIAINTGFKKSDIDGESIQSGDYKIIFAATGITVDVRADNVECVFDGVDLNIISVDSDPADARHILHCRAL